MKLTEFFANFKIPSILCFVVNSEPLLAPIAFLLSRNPLANDNFGQRRMVIFCFASFLLCVVINYNCVLLCGHDRNAQSFGRKKTRWTTTQKPAAKSRVWSSKGEFSWCLPNPRWGTFYVGLSTMYRTHSNAATALGLDICVCL